MLCGMTFRDENDPRLKWVIDYHTGAFKRLRQGGYEKYVAMTNEYNKEGEFLHS